MARRRLAPLLILVTLLSRGLPAAAGGPSMETSYDLAEIGIEAQGLYSRVTIPGTGTIKIPGAPALPVRILQFVIPANLRVEEVLVRRLEEEILPGAYRVVPAQPEAPIGEVQQWVDPDPLIYESAAGYPEARVQYLGDGYLGGYHIAGVAVHPVTYEPSAGRLTLARRIEVELSLVQGSRDAQPRHRMTARADRMYRRLVEGLVVNPQDVAGKLGPVEIVDSVGPEGFEPRYTPSLEGSAVEYVIVTSDEFASRFQELADWKTKKGVPTVVKTVSWIDANYSGGCDTAERIRYFLKDAYSSWGTTYALMAGDTDIVPVRYAWCQYYGGWYIPTDVYYSDLDGNWNRNGNSDFGEGYVSIASPGDSTDLYPDVFVGRAPVANAIEVEAFIDKTLAYEKAPAPHFAERSLYMAEVLFPYYWEPGMDWTTCGAADIVEPALPLVPEWINIVRLYQRSSDYPGSYQLNRASALDSLNAGYNITVHVGHGNKDILRVSKNNYVTPHDADALSNGITKSGFMWMLNCSSTDIGADCISEHFMNNPDGGCSYLFGPTRFCFPGTAVFPYTVWFDLLYTDGMTAAGVVSASCKIPFIPASFYNSPERWTQLSFIFLGDPESRLWTDRPGALTVLHDATIGLGPTVLAVTVTDPSMVEGALVCVAKEEEVYATGTTDGSGQVLLSFTPKTTGTMTVTVTAQDRLPYESAIGIASSPSPHLTFRSVVVDDDGAGWSNGNGNGDAEAGEAVELDVTIGNGGQSQASGVTATVLDGDPYLTLVDGTHFLGDIPALTEIQFQDAFLVSIADDCPNGYEAGLELTLSDASRTTWTDEFVLTVYRPNLVQHHNDYDDGLTGDGVPNVGETVTLTVDVLNDGNGEADLVTGVLRYPTADVAIADSTDTWGDIVPGATASGQSGFVFDVNAVITEPFELVLTDEGGREWRHSFDALPPAEVFDLAGTVRATTISLSWEPSQELDLWGYNVYRTDHPAGTPELANDGVIERVSYFEDAGLEENTLYYYRVTAVDSSGNGSRQSSMLEITTNPPSQTGWPLLAGEAMFGTPAVADIDLDGDLEVMVGSRDIYCWHHDGLEYMDGDGDPRTNGVFTVDGLGGYRSSVAIGEMDGDPYPELVCASMGDFGDDGSSEYRIFAWNADDGTLVDGWPVSTTKFCWATAALGDLTGDGLAEVVIPCADGYLYGWDSSGDEIIDGDNDPSTDGVFAWLGAEWAYGSPTLVDIDADRDLEIIVGSRNDSVYCWNGDGTRVPGWPVWAGSGDPGGVVASPCAADLNGDGSVEVVVIASDLQLIVFSASGATLDGWPVAVDVGGDFPPSPTVADLTGNGKLEIIQLDENGLVHVFTWQGEAVDGWPQPTAPGGVLPQSSASVGDVDGDGLPDVIVGDNGFKVNAFHADGEMIRGWPILTDGQIYASPTLADLDGDGDVEVIVSGMDVYVYVWDCESPYEEGETVQWATWRHDSSRTGFFGHEAPVGVANGHVSAPLTLALEQNVPNPFNPTTRIAYHVPAGVAGIGLRVHDVTGRLVRTLVEGAVEPGRHAVAWDGRDERGAAVASGVYFVRLSAGERSSAKKILLLK